MESLILITCHTCEFCDFVQSSYIPRMVCDLVDSLIKGFVWGSTSKRIRVHNLSWIPSQN
ncbi:hypothetical protein V2J09_018056 [Rumex salicifolius]